MTDETHTADGRGRYNKFQHGTIYWFPDTGINMKYRFTMNSFRITNTRAPHEDTVYVSLAAQVNNQPVKDISTFMGDLNNGAFYPNIALEFYIPDGKNVALSYVILNKGHSDTGENVAKTASTVAATIASSVYPVAAPYIDIANKIITSILNFILPDCDGTVAADKYTLSSLDIAEKLGNKASYTVKDKYYPGTDSPTFCGSNSQYYVTWTLSVL